MARPKPELTLTEDERLKLTSWAKRSKSSQRLALRARIVLACADEPSNKAVAAKLNVCNATVGTWRNRFLAKRLDSLTDDPRPGAPRLAWLIVGAVLSRGRRIVTSWIRAAGLSGEYRP